MPENLSDVLTDHLAAATFESLPPEAVSRAKTRLLDALGLIAAGVRAQGSAEIVRLVEGWGGRPDATVLTTRTKVPAMHAALANAVLMRSYDFEPVGADRADGVQIPSHITGTTTSVALAVAEARGASGRELLTAMVYGDDLAARLGHATGFDVYGGGDNTGTINALGGTATAGILMGLDAAGLKRALGIAINQLGGTIDNINDKTLSFKLPIALSSRNAVFSAELAAAGFGGPDDPIGGRFGFLSQWSAGDPDLAAITDGLGSAFYADATIKPWPTCRASQPSLDATVQLVSRFGVRARDVERAVVHLTPRVKNGFVGQEFRMGESPEVSGAFSIRFAVATALLDGTVRVDHQTREHMESPRLASMLDRVELVPSLDPSAGSAAEVEVTLRSGAVHRVRVEKALGDIHFTPLDDERILRKFRDNVAWGGLTPEAGDRLRDLALGVDAIADLGEIPALLAR
ncbi:MmgE/PrpD family protein [Microbacterium sp. NPDC096154]|uniref:MmgE/PrpD family protein n=1 Tax=Microbacterium sp. NPDC096154 TaxID=3155549 RepID=UPI003329FDCD